MWQRPWNRGKSLCKQGSLEEQEWFFDFDFISNVMATDGRLPTDSMIDPKHYVGKSHGLILRVVVIQTYEAMNIFVSILYIANGD